VQQRFAEEYFGGERVAHSVLDFGCGPGLFSRLFARNGASVLGVDTNAGHLETARRLVEEDALSRLAFFEQLELPPERTLGALRERGLSFDLIFLSDVLMFYFVSYTGEALDAAALLRALAELLTPDGVIAVLEPQGTFWQQPWLGDEGRPFTILTEYRDRRYGVTPTLEQLGRTAEAAGLVISRIREPVATGGAPAGFERAYAFAAEFPLWWYFELKRAG
jgi:SAM-dependent methyltransferase